MVALFHYYLLGRPFILVTDHALFRWIQSAKTDDACITRWALALQPFHFSVKHFPGKKNSVADFFSYKEEDEAQAEMGISINWNTEWKVASAPFNLKWGGVCSREPAGLYAYWGNGHWDAPQSIEPLAVPTVRSEPVGRQHTSPYTRSPSGVGKQQATCSLCAHPPSSAESWKPGSAWAQSPARNESRYLPLDILYVNIKL